MDTHLWKDLTEQLISFNVPFKDAKDTAARAIVEVHGKEALNSQLEPLESNLEAL
jgi:hypothetical protein